MEVKEVFWNQFGLEGYIERLDELSAINAGKTDATVQDAFKKLPAAVHLNPYHDKDRGIRKMNHLGEIILYSEHKSQIEVLGAFSERSDWMKQFRA